MESYSGGVASWWCHKLSVGSKTDTHTKGNQDPEIPIMSLWLGWEEHRSLPGVIPVVEQAANS